MRYRAELAVMGIVALIGCSDDTMEPIQLPSYEVTTLRALPEGTEVTFVDLNENGQALWLEDGTLILWDDEDVIDLGILPANEFRTFLGPGGSLLVFTLDGSFLWEDGETTPIDGLPMGITEDGTPYYVRADTVFAWTGGVEEATDLPVGRGVAMIGPEGRVFKTEPNGEFDNDCFEYEDGEWKILPRVLTTCEFVMAEENGWVLLRGSRIQEGSRSRQLPGFPGHSWFCSRSHQLCRNLSRKGRRSHRCSRC